MDPSTNLTSSKRRKGGNLTTRKGAGDFTTVVAPCGGTDVFIMDRDAEDLNSDGTVRPPDAEETRLRTLWAGPFDYFYQLPIAREL